MQAKPKRRREKERSPSVQFYFRQFSGDENVQAMDLDVIGAHILLICFAGSSAERYRLVYDKEKLRRLLRNESVQRFEQILAQLLEGAWKISEDGLWIEQHGLHRSLQKQKDFSPALGLGLH